jgi:putative transposase
MKKTFKFRAYINKEIEHKSNSILEMCRIIYNLCLEQRRSYYAHTKKSISCYDQINQLPDLKDAFPEYKNIPSQTLQDVVERLDKSFKGFFNRIKRGVKSGYPRFRKYGRYDSFTLKNAGWELIDNKLIIKKIGTFKLKLSREIIGNIKTVTVKRNATGKWFVCFSCDNVPKNILPKTKQSIGIDVGCEAFITDSNGLKIENPRWLNKSQEKLAKAQKELARKERKSKRREKQRIKVAKIHERIANQRRDFQHKVSKHYVENYDVICIEKMKSWNTYTPLNRSMRDVAWFQFFDMLRYKAEYAGKEVVEINPKNTSQICSGCGAMVPKTLDVRIHSCPHCGLILDRDLNAARNILRVGTTQRSSLFSQHLREASVFRHM